MCSIESSLFMESARIVAICNDQPEPLYGSAAENLPSPSPTLLIEAHRCRPNDWHTRTIPNQVLTLFLEPGSVMHAAGGSAPSAIAVPAQAVVFSLRGQPETVQWMKPTHVLGVQIDDRVLADAAQNLFEAQNFELLPSSGVHDARLSSLLNAIYVEQAGGYASGRLFVDGIEQALAALLVSHHGTRKLQFQAAAGGLPASRARRLVEYIEAHLDGSLTLKELADCAAYSPSHFSRLFRETFHMGPHRFVLNLRIERAKALLTRRDHSILEVALLCGFQTQQHFARIFRQLVGITPGEYRRNES
jgi:AraC family transcriptional regulator